VDILSAVPNSQEDRTAYLEKIRQHGILRYETAHRRKDGSIITVEVSTSVIQFGERDIVLGIDRDITRRKLSELEIRRHVAELEALYENGLAVGRLLKPGEIGNRVIETFARYLSWHHVAIRLRRDDSDDLDLVAFSLPDLKEADRARIEQHFMASLHKVGQGLSGWVMQTGKPFRTGEVHSQSQYVETLAGIHSGLYMPLKVGERVIGVISVESEAPDAFTEEDERLLATLANQAAIAFENARLYATIQNELAERKRAEEALRASESHYRELADSITDILFETDEDLRYTHWNKASESFSGIPAQDAIGKSMRELFGTSQEQSKREEIYKSILKEQRARTFETQVVAKGQKRALEINAYPSLRGVSVVAKDVTERKRAEIIMQKRFELMEYAASHTLSELMQRTVDEVSELTGSAIGFFRFVEADSTSPALQTWSAETLWSFSATIEQEPPPALDQAGTWAEAARQRRSLLQNDCETVSQVAVLRQIVIPIVRGDQIVAMMSIANKPQNYTQDDLEIAGHLADHAWDIIERKQMELALETERNQLARRVEERTADLSRANSNLARALRVKDEFLANMSHELRTPLNAILGLSESLGEQIAGPLNEKQQKYITTISESGHHLLSLINDILDLAKIEAGQITLDINKVDIRSVCQSSLRMVKQLAQKKNQEISLEIDDGLGLMWADERRLKQMIVNLLGNAVKFTPEHGKLGLEVHGDRAANKIAIMVWDHGIGIQAEDLARLFQPFVQLDSGLAREATGTGLGLALVAQMARLHGGTVSAVSEPEQGSRFTIVLPWEPALAIQTASHLRNTGKLRALPAGPSRKPTVLLVEDSGDVTMMIRDYLERAGYKIVTAGDGLECLTQARRARPDLILMDIQLPHMDGLEATRRLRSEPEFRYTPIIALTALAMPNDRERCLAAGMDEYISKPINLKALVKLIQNCLFDHEEAPPR
jgi:PAS domain S-box-containing protein